MNIKDSETLFWKIAEEMYSDSSVKEGTMMGFKCLRADGAFFATFDHRSGDLIVKLPRERVQSLIAEKIGQPFAPAGRVFREWAGIPNRDPKLWRVLLSEAKSFVGK